MSARDDLPWVKFLSKQPQGPRPAVAWETMERSELVEIAMRLHRAAANYQRRFEQACAAIDRVEALAAEWDDRQVPYDMLAADLRAALAGEQS